MFRLRRTETTDIPLISKLITTSNSANKDLTLDLSKRFYGPFNIGSLIEKEPFSVVADSVNGDSIYGFAVFSNTNPTSTSILELIATHGFHSNNSYFLKFLVVDPLVADAFIQQSLAALFQSVSRIQNVIYFLPKDISALFPPLSIPKYLHLKQLTTTTASPDFIRRGSFPKNDEATNHQEPLFNRFLEGSDNLHLTYVCKRDDVIPKMTVRRAKMEDSDDLLPMFRKYNMLEQNASDYHVANLIESTDDNIINLVGEINGKVIGFISLTANVDVKSLSELFHLDAFADLLQVELVKKAKSFAQMVSIGKSLGGGLEKGISKNNMLSQNNMVSQLKLKSITSFHELVDEKAIHQAELTEPHEESKVVSVTPEIGIQQILETKQPETKPSNSFSIQLFCLEDRFSGYAWELLQPAFDSFPEKDVCFLAQKTNMAESPLSQHLFPIAARDNMDASSCLYLTTRFSNKPIQVRPAMPVDVEGIYKLIEDLPNEGELVALLTSSKLIPSASVTKTHAHGNLAIFVAVVKHEIVGLIVIDHYDESFAYPDQYDIAQFCDLSQYASLHNIPILLKHMVLNPLLYCQARNIFEQLFQQLQTNLMIYPFVHSSTSDPATRSIVLKEFMHVPPRRQIKYPNNLRDGDVVIPPHPFAIRILSTSILHDPKLVFNTKIVVCGASETGLAFLESLVNVPHLHFSDLTLISISGLPTPPPNLETLDPHQYVHDDLIEYTDTSPLGSSMSFEKSELLQIGLENQVRLIRKTVIGIHRVSKNVVLHDGTLIPYDYLFLTPGLQYQLPVPQFSEMNQIPHCYGLTNSQLPDIFNSISDLYHGQHSARTEGKNLVAIYGRSLASLAMLQYIIEKGIDPTRIVLITPQNSVSCLENFTCDEKLDTIFENLKVQKITGNIISWKSNDDGIESVTLEDGQAKEVSCLVFLYGLKKTINPFTFTAINDACLIYDGRLVIDNQFRTNDPSIFAAGSVTKYSIKYRTKWNQMYYNSREVGYKLGSVILRMFDPLSDESTDSKIIFTKPKIMQAYLPGGFFFMHFDRPHLPGDFLDLKLKNGDEMRGKIIATRVENTEHKNQSYVRIYVDNDGYIRSFTYFGGRTAPYSNYICLSGLHEKYLNRLISRYDEGLITDLTQFLDEEWALPIYHDGFVKFIETSRRELIQTALNTDLLPETQLLIHRMQEYDKLKKEMNDEEKQAAFEKFEASSERKFMGDKAASFLKQVLPPIEKKTKKSLMK